MRLLLDTHIAVWLAWTPGRLSTGEFQLLRSADSGLTVSAVSIWELRIKWNSYFKSGKRKGPGDPAQFVEAFARMRLNVVPLEPDHAAAALQVPIAHKDPFDELLLVQAQELGMKLVTRDRKLAGHPLVHIVEQ